MFFNKLISFIKLLVKEVTGFLVYNYENFESSESFKENNKYEEISKPNY